MDDPIIIDEEINYLEGGVGDNNNNQGNNYHVVNSSQLFQIEENISEIKNEIHPGDESNIKTYENLNSISLEDNLIDPDQNKSKKKLNSLPS